MITVRQSIPTSVTLFKILQKNQIQVRIVITTGGVDHLYHTCLVNFFNFQMGHFYYSAKAFDMLERLDPNPEYWEGKRGASIGLFQMIIAGREERQYLADMVQILKNTTNPQVEQIVKVIKKWAKDNRVAV